MSRSLAAVAGSVTVEFASRRDDFLTMALALWMMFGLLIDAKSHSTNPGLEAFWTSSHAVFYSGFVATALWVIRLSLIRRRRTGGILDWAPSGYRLAIIGVGVFGLGGVGDAIWHTAFGVESGLDALLSPTHLLLFVGMLGIVSAPFRAAWSDTPTVDPGFQRFLAPLASMTFTVTLVAFFFGYVWLLSRVEAPQTRFNPNLGRGEIEAVLGVAGAVMSTVILMTGPIVASRRWTLPFGSVAILFFTSAAFVSFAFDESTIGLLPALVAGFVADAALSAKAPRYVFLIAPPLVLWLGFYFLVAQTGAGLRWPPEVWGGSVVLASLASLAIDQLVSSGVFLSRLDTDP